MRGTRPPMKTPKSTQKPLGPLYTVRTLVRSNLPCQWSNAAVTVPASLSRNWHARALSPQHDNDLDDETGADPLYGLIETAEEKFALLLQLAMTPHHNGSAGDPEETPSSSSSEVLRELLLQRRAEAPTTARTDKQSKNPIQRKRLFGEFFRKYGNPLYFRFF